MDDCTNSLGIQIATEETDRHSYTRTQLSRTQVPAHFIIRQSEIHSYKDLELQKLTQFLRPIYTITFTASTI
jgi:hypothetical protein